MALPSDLDQVLLHAEGARRLARSLLRDPHRADDVAQDALVTALERAPARLRNPRAWLATVTRNRARELTRKDARRTRHEQRAPRRAPPDPAEVQARAQMSKRLIDAVLRLPEAYRVPVWMRFFEETPPRVIARELDLPVETVRTRVRRGLARMRADLDTEFGGDRARWRAAVGPLAGSGAGWLVGGALVSMNKVAVGVGVVVLLGALLAGGILWFAPPPSVPAPADTELVRGDAPSGDTRAVELVGTSTPPDADATVAQGPVGPGVVVGRVEDAQGQPVAGLAVALHRHTADDRPPEAPGAFLGPTRFAEVDRTRKFADAVTDDAGAFAFRRLAAGSYYLVVPPTATRPPVSQWVWLRPGAGHARARIVLPEASPLRFQVTGKDGQPVQAVVRGYRTYDGEPGWAFPPLATDAQGRLMILAPAGELQLHAHVLGHVEAKVFHDHAAPGSDVAIALHHTPEAVVFGQVTNERDEPIAGARVAVASRRVASSESAGIRRAATTDATGTYRLEGLWPGHLARVSVAAEGYVARENVSHATELPAGTPVRIDLQLLRGGVVSGTVLDADGKPVAGAHVRSDADEGSSDARTRTDAQGAFRLAHVPLGTGQVRVRARGYYQRLRSDRQVVERYDLAADRTEATVDVTLQPAVPVQGRVIDATGAPVPHAWLEMRGFPKAANWNADHPLVDRVTDAQGRFTWAVPPARGSWKLTAFTARGRSDPVEFNVVDGPPEPLELVVQPGATISGVVMQGDQPAYRSLRVHVKKQGSMNLTVPVARDGTFRLDGVVAGSGVRLYAVNREHNRVSNEVTLDLAWGQVVEDVRLEVEVQRALAGTVVDDEGTPLENLRLELHVETPHHSSSMHTTTDRRGRFRFDSVRDTGYPYSIGVHGKRLPGAFKAGDMDIRIVYGRVPTLRFRGTVLLPDGTPASGRVDVVAITPRTSRNAGSRTGHSATLAEGSFTFAYRRIREDTTFGLVVRQVSDAKGRRVNARPVFIESIQPDTPVTVRLEEGLTLRGRVEDGQGAPVEGVTVRLDPAHDHPLRGWINPNPRITAEDARFEFTALPPGKFRLRVRVPEGFSPAAPVWAEAGDGDVRIVVKRGAVLAGRVRGPDGAAVSNASVTFSWKRLPGSGGPFQVSTTTEADGTFEMRNVPPDSVGQLYVRPARRDRDRLSHTGVPDIRAGTRDIQVRLDTPLFIEGTVIGGDGKKVRGSIWAGPASAAPPAQRYHGMINDRTGAFRLGPLPAGKYLLTLQVGGEHVAPAPVSATSPSKGLRIVAPRGHLVKGRVTNAGDPNNVHVQFYRMTARGMTGHTAGMTGTGDFLATMPDDTAGTLHAYERNTDNYALLEDVRPSEAPFTLTLQKGSVIEGRVAGASEATAPPHVYAQSANGLYLYAKTDKDGTFRFRGVPPGQYQVMGVFNRRGLKPVVGVEAGATDVVLHAAE